MVPPARQSPQTTANAVSGQFLEAARLREVEMKWPAQVPQRGVWTAKQSAEGAPSLPPRSRLVAQR